jgi:hypothetical protein
MRTLGCRVSGAPTDGPRPQTTLTTPAGKISASSSPSFRAVSGVCSDADRVAADHAREPGEVLARDRSGHRPAGAREVPEHVGDRRDLVTERGRVRLAAIERLELGVRLTVGLDAIGEPQEQCRAVFRRRARPRIERSVRGLHRGVDLASRRFGHPREHLAGRGVQHLFDLALARDESAVDQELGLHVGTPKVDAGDYVWPDCSSGRVR